MKYIFHKIFTETVNTKLRITVSKIIPHSTSFKFQENFSYVRNTYIVVLNLPRFSGIKKDLVFL